MTDLNTFSSLGLFDFVLIFTSAIVEVDNHLLLKHTTPLRPGEDVVSYVTFSMFYCKKGKYKTIFIRNMNTTVYI